jgi:predicted NAD/FAD-binding protein
VDTGFIVYNEPNYPNLTGLFEVLGVATRETEMSFAASLRESRVEYAGSDLNSLFAQRSNLLSPPFLVMVWDILRFNRLCKRLLREDGFGDLTLSDLLRRERLGDRFRDHYLLPMAAAIWSCPPRTMLSFPAASFARFFANHGLLDLRNRPQWRTVIGGSHTYVNRILSDLGPDARCGDPVVRVARREGAVDVTLASGERQEFDQVVLACHADQALALLGDPSPAESDILSRFRYQPNRALLHSDKELMPDSRRVWSSWNYLASTDNGRVESVSVTYWMNRLQGIPGPTQFFVSLNPLVDPCPERLIAEMTYHHPVFDQAAMNAQDRLGELQGRDRVWYSGSYFGYGFHEDALRASVQVAEALGVQAPWLASRPAKEPTSPIATSSIAGGAE